jgi:hypothetical protein
MRRFVGWNVGWVAASRVERSTAALSASAHPIPVDPGSLAAGAGAPRTRAGSPLAGRPPLRRCCPARRSRRDVLAQLSRARLPARGLEGCRQRLIWSLTSASLARVRFEMVFRLSQKPPLLFFPHMCVSPTLCRRRHNLGFNVRRYRGKLLIKPSKSALQRHRKRLAAEMSALRGANALAVIQRLNPIIRGWSTYYRAVVSSEAFAGLDNYMWSLTYKWAKYSHTKKSKHWIVHRYFGEFNQSRRARWLFGDR